MRTKHLLLFFAVLVAGSFTAVNTISTKGDQYKGADEKINPIQECKSGQRIVTDTGFYFDVAVLQSIRQDLKEELANQTGGELTWKSVGPNNVAGRIRAIIVDNTAPEHNVLYAGSASGGIFKSNTNGQYWERVEVNYKAGIIAVSSMVQISDGTIYATTGEVFDSIYVSKMNASKYPGVGVLYKNPNSEVFEHMASTDPVSNPDFFGVTQIAVDPNNKTKMYLSTWNGLYTSTDAGASWTKDATIPSAYVGDVKINTNGVVVTSANGEVYVNNGSGFTVVSGHDSNLIDSGGVRYEFEFAPSNQNYLYAIGAAENEKLLGVYRSTSAGAAGTWEKIAIGGSDNFAIFKEAEVVRNSGYIYYHGIESMMLAVNPTDENYVYIGGATLWAGFKVEGVVPFQWEQKTYSFLPEYFPLYLSSNIHTMVPKPNSNTFYIGCDGGVFRYTKGLGTSKLNSYLTTGQFYDVSFGPEGEIIAGSQDNGIFINDFQGPCSQRFFGRKIIEEADNQSGVTHGFGGLISQINPDIFLYEHSYARLKRTLDNGISINEIYDTNMSDIKNLVWAVQNAPMAMWESEDYEFGYDTYSYKVYADSIPAGTIDTVESRNVAGTPIYLNVENTLYKDSIVSYEDPFKSIYAIGIKGQVWVTHKATSNLEMLKWDWFDVFNAYEIYDVSMVRFLDATVQDIVLSEDGHHMYLSVGIVAKNLLQEDTVTKTEFYRIDSLHTVMKDARYSWSLANHTMNPDTIPNDICAAYTQKLGQVYTKEGSSVTIDPNNKGTLIITFANYEDEDKVYVCSNANTTTSEIFSENFRSIQSNLPKIAIFDGLINVNTDNNKKQLMLGTEVGIWSTDNYTSLNPIWKFNSMGIGPIPVTTIKQQTYPYEKYSRVKNYGIIYASTFGGGIFIDSTYYIPRTDDTPETPSTVNTLNSFKANVYPNPVERKMTIKFITGKETNTIKVRILDLTGKTVLSENIGEYTQGEFTYDIEAQNLDMGIYLVEISDGQNAETVKIIKK